ncbi:MAG: radical SAM protein [Clostridia bacterium]|nr:radical SAM protein [Clostridia bacterium]
MDNIFRIAHYGLHYGEEPIISGTSGSGTVFFSGCNMHCVYCQNYVVSQQRKGKLITGSQLLDIFAQLQDMGAHNINLVTPTPYIRLLIDVLRKAKQFLTIPIVYNTSSYEYVTYLSQLDGLVDVYLADIKYYDNDLAIKYSQAPDYFDIATQSVSLMRSQQPQDIIVDGIMKKGLIIRHLTLPHYKEDSKCILDWIANFDSLCFVSLMSQYVPCGKAHEYAPLNDKVSSSQYKQLVNYMYDLGLTNGYTQQPSSATTEYIPHFNQID